MSNIDQGKAAQMMFDFIGRAAEVDDVEGIMEEMTKAANFFGMTCFAISGIPRPSEKIDPYFLLSGWREEWFRRYLAENHVHSDPVIYQTKVSDEPFVWSEALALRPLGPLSKRVMNEATEFRMMDGFSVPIHMPGGSQAIVTYGAEQVDLSPEARVVLQMISIYAHNRLRAIIRPATMRRREAPSVTPAELEVLHWAGEGKTNWEISQITGKAQKTIEHIVTRLQNKLNCSNRAQVIAESIRFGIIR